MACKTSFELHHNFPKLAEEAGFTFNTHRPRVHIQWNKIKLIDIESLVRNRNFNIVEQHLNDILDCVIDLEFDVRILDEGFLKIFRLAQLAVEYQQFCRHYLDRSIFVLKEEITNLLHELDTTKKILKEKEEEIRKMRRKVKHPTRTQLPYGNDNIAKMIINALSHNKAELYNSSSHLDTINYNKCDYCDKAFLNQLYLQSHISRRHGDILEAPQKETETKMNSTTGLSNEIIDLKTKLKQMEDLILNSNTKTGENSNDIATGNTESTIHNIPVKAVKDAEVWTSDNIIGPLEQVKETEQESYAKEIHLLRTQILDLIKDKNSENEMKMMEELNATIKSQGDEILALKQELRKENARDTEDRHKIETQLNYWCKKAESQEIDFKALQQKLSDVENQAREYRAKAEAEKEKSGQLQSLLQQHLSIPSKHPAKQISPSHKSKTISDDDTEQPKKPAVMNKISSTTAEQIVLKKLQERAQELLNIDQISSETSTMSDMNSQNHKKLSNNNKKEKTLTKRSNSKSDYGENSHFDVNEQNQVKIALNYDIKTQKVSKAKKKLSNTKKDRSFPSPGSPVKVVRAKLTEEINYRLANLGIDPLKNKLPKTTYFKQRMLLQEQREIKLKKCPVREKVLHSIIAHLDTKATNSYRSNSENNVLSPNKSYKAFSLSSVLSNVKTKALSLVKLNEKTDSPKKSYKYIAKKPTALIKSSPEITRLSTSNDEINRDVISKISSEEESSENKKKIISTSSKKLKHKIVVSNGRIDSESSDQDLVDPDKLRPTNKNILNFKSTVRTPYESPIRLNNSNNIAQNQPEIIVNNDRNDDSSDGIESLVEFPPRKALSEDNISSVKQTKGVLKNASSTSSLKKKVIFDMDAIQMKSVSASPSQSTTEKSDNNETYELGIVNLDTEEWDVSSIENLVLPEIAKEETKPNSSKYQSTKFTELKETIENKLMGRNQTLSTAPKGGVDVLSVPLQRGINLGGSNTSLGSSILDDTDSGGLQVKN